VCWRLRVDGQAYMRVWLKPEIYIYIYIFFENKTFLTSIEVHQAHRVV